jgi:transglutaminase-like putative cysteine protease
MKHWRLWLSSRKWALLAVLLFGVAGGYGVYHQTHDRLSTSASGQTDVDRAEHRIDRDGLPYLEIVGIGKQYHPAWVAIYALAYAGIETYDPRLANLKNAEKFSANVDWLERNLNQQANGLWVWEYGFDSTYNDVSIKAPWSSAFAQATGIQAFLAAYREKGDKKYLELASKAALALYSPLSDGGFLFESGNDIWFEEIPSPAENPSHILNGHMRVLLALKELAVATGESQVQHWLKRGTDTLYRWLPLFDSGYWLRYDLNPRKTDLLFRFANPYGLPNHPLAVDKITLRDPISKREVSVDVGGQSDAEGANRFAGTHWGPIEQLAGRTVRRLVPSELENKPDEMGAPHTYFYLSLPNEWKDNLRDQWYELIVDYYDDGAADITVQQRAISPGQTFRDLRDGDLYLDGAGQWRRWIVPLRSTDLGYWVGRSYAEKHAEYLEKIARWDERFEPWAGMARGYAALAEKDVGTGRAITSYPAPLPQQTPPPEIFDRDKNGVIRQGGIYHPFIIADQALTLGQAIPANAVTRFSRTDLRRKPALDWLLDSKNYLTKGEAAIYTFPIDNAYNDVFSKAPWQSSFIQAYALKALRDAGENDYYSPLSRVNTGLFRATRAFEMFISDGGITTNDRKGLVWYEEVPNATHVLNAHLASIVELAHASRYLKSTDIQLLSESGIRALREHLHRFDSGYWLRYDLNPRKELLFQIDWLSGEKAPLIDAVLLENPQTGNFVRLDVGSVGDTVGSAHIHGAEWLGQQEADGKTGRSFGNGYSLRTEASLDAGGTRHNAYLVMNLPDGEFGDYFDVPAHRLVIRYKDVSQGEMAVKIRAIDSGNQLAFAPLRAGVWPMKGDGQWKEAVFVVRPQDIGWFKGAEYQSYEVEQIRNIANLTNDWFFYQYAERHRHFLDKQLKGIPNSTPGVSKFEAASRPTAGGRGPVEDLDGTLLSATDPRNPLRIFRIPVTNRIAALSDELTAGTTSDDEKISRFLDFIAGLRVGSTSDATPDTAVRERVGACGNFVNVLLALAVSQGIEGRVIGLYNHPKDDGHVMAELKIGGRRVLVDPTYGSFYTDAKGRKLGLGEIRTLLSRGGVVKRVHRFVRYPNPLDVDKDNVSLAILARNEPWTWFEAYSDPKIFVSANPVGVVGPDRPMVFPLQLDLAVKNVLDAPMLGPRNQGADYIGAASPNQNQEWIVTGLSAGVDYVFSLAPKGLHGYITADDRTFHLRGT